MKCAFLIIALMSAGLVVRAEYPVGTNASIVRLASSYYTLNCAGCYADSGKYMRWWTNNIGCYEENRSGGSIQEGNENRLERRCLPLLAQGSQWWIITHVDNNGGYTTTNQVYAQYTNTLNATALLFNGSAYVDEGGWAASHAGQMNFVAVGDIPQPDLASEAAPRTRNTAMTNAPAFFPSVYAAIDVFNPIFWEMGRSNDIYTGANNWQVSLDTTAAPHDGEHPGPPGALLMAINEDRSWMNTNVNSLVVDYTAASLVSTQACTVTGVSKSGGTISFTWKANWHPLGWDYPDGTITNDAWTAAAAMWPGISNAFNETFTITNAPAGNYTITEDGSNILTIASVGGVVTFNLFPLMKGAEWAQRKAVVNLCRDMQNCDRTTLHNGSAGGGGEVGWDSNMQAQWNLGKRGDTLISSAPSSVANMLSLKTAINAAAVPTNHTFSITLQGAAVYAPFRIAGQFMDGTNFPASDEWTNEWAFHLEGTTNLFEPHWQPVPAAVKKIKGHLGFVVSNAETEMYCRAVYQLK